MKKFPFLPFLASRQFLAFLALIVVALVIWFVGPFFTFGGLKPFADAGMRALAGGVAKLFNFDASRHTVPLRKRERHAGTGTLGAGAGVATGSGFGTGRTIARTEGLSMKYLFATRLTSSRVIFSMSAFIAL